MGHKGVPLPLRWTVQVLGKAPEQGRTEDEMNGVNLEHTTIVEADKVVDRWTMRGTQGGAEL